MPLLAAAAELSDLDRWGALLEDWSGGDVVGAEPWRRFGSAACGARFNTFQERDLAPLLAGRRGLP